jgi:hypothetical protein
MTDTLSTPPGRTRPIIVANHNVKRGARTGELGAGHDLTVARRAIDHTAESAPASSDSLVLYPVRSC